MSETITVPGRNINTITAEIVGIATQTAQILLMSAVEMGKRMTEAKGLCNHGEWGDYLEDLCKQIGISQSTAHNWMRLHRQYGDNPNLQALGNLDYTKAVRLLALPEGEREDFVQQNDVEKMSSRELDKAIKERDAAQELLAVAQDHATAAEQKAEDRQKEIDKLNAALNKVTAAEEKAKAQLDKLKKSPPKVPAEMIEKIGAEAAEQAQKEFQAKLDAAQKELAAANEARAAAEQAAKAAQQQATAAQKASKLSNPDMASFNVMFGQVQEDFNKLHGYLIKIRNADAELGGKCVVAITTLLENMRTRVG